MIIKKVKLWTDWCLVYPHLKCSMDKDRVEYQEHAETGEIVAAPESAETGFNCSWPKFCWSCN